MGRASRPWRRGRPLPAVPSPAIAPSFTTLFFGVGWTFAAVILALTVIHHLPSPVDRPTTALVLTAAGLAAWVATLLTQGRPPWLFPFLLICGIAGAAADVVDPGGPSYLLCYLAISALAMRVPGVRGDLGAAAVAVALTLAEALAYGEATAGVEILLGAAFVFLASKSAIVNRTAREQTERLLAQEAATRRAEADAAALAERARIARDLHDSLAHALAGSAIQLESAAVLAERTGADPALRSALDTARRLTRDGLRSARDAVATLRIAGSSGARHIPDLVEGFGTTTAQRVSFAVSGTPTPISASADSALFHTVQEALTNAAKYAAPQARVAVRLVWSAGRVAVSVQDSGGGSTDASTLAPVSGGFGLLGLQERVDAARGTLQAGTSAGGWCVRAELPTTTAMSP